ncbi:MAG: hypothetical protein AAFY65_06410 [Pseudomonadota bacterium]
MKDEHAAVSIEVLIWLPIMVFVYAGGIQYFMAYRQETQMTKATFMIGDLLSREEGIVSIADLEGLQDVFEFVTDAEGKTNMRFSQVQRVGNALTVTDSYSTDGGAQLTDARLRGFYDQIPTLQDNERVIVVEAYLTYEPYFSFFLPSRVMERFVPTRSRYTPQMVFDPAIPAPSGVVNTGGSFDDGTTVNQETAVDFTGPGMWINGMWIPLPNQAPVAPDPSDPGSGTNPQ